MVDVAAAEADVPDRPPAAADPPGREPHQREPAGEAGEDVEQDRLTARRLRVALDRDRDRVLRGRAGGDERVLGTLEDAGIAGLRRPPADHADELAAEDGAHGGEGDAGEAERQPVGGAMIRGRLEPNKVGRLDVARHAAEIDDEPGAGDERRRSRAPGGR